MMHYNFEMSKEMTLVSGQWVMTWYKLLHTILTSESQIGYIHNWKAEQMRMKAWN